MAHLDLVSAIWAIVFIALGIYAIGYHGPDILRIIINKLIGYPSNNNKTLKKIETERTS